MVHASTRRDRLATALVELASVRGQSAQGPRTTAGLGLECDPGDWRARRLARSGAEVLEAAGAIVLILDAAGVLRVAASWPAPPVGTAVQMSHASRLSALELAQGSGPGIEAVRTGELVSADLTVGHGQWPAWSAAAVSIGWLRVVAVPLRVAGSPAGVLELLHGDPAPPTEAYLVWTCVLSGVTAAALAHQQALQQERVLAEHLQAALDSRVVIEQAKGILAERGGIDVGTAFDRLRAYSRARRALLADVARQVVDGTGADAVLGRHRPERPAEGYPGSR